MYDCAGDSFAVNPEKTQSATGSAFVHLLRCLHRNPLFRGRSSWKRKRGHNNI